MEMQAFLAGMTTGLGLIVAIGAQNAYVLRQGVRGEHVLAVCLACALSDAVLIGVGVGGFARVATAAPWLDPVLRVGGAAFLTWYAARSLAAALGASGALGVEADGAARTLAPVLLACLAITWLNPHVYLDTVVLIGTVSTQFPGAGAAFAAGAVAGSFLFFFGLGYGAAWLRPVFARPASWRLLEGGIAVVMATLAVRLALG